jgi:CDP-glucose 4,6-dehydratase
VRLRYPRAVRPWLHVIEPLAGYLAIAERLIGLDAARYSTAFNFGPGPAGDANVEQISQKIAQLWGEGAHVEIASGPHPPEASTLRLDVTKAARLLGWRARWDFIKTLELAVDWYKAWNAGRDVRPIMARQIAEYLAADR